MVSDVDGVVAGIEAEAGQVVSAGTAVVRIAQAVEKEVVLGMPENKVDSLRKISDARIWAAGDHFCATQLQLHSFSPLRLCF
jgi:multidrug efflux system membrane fusion protein